VLEVEFAGEPWSIGVMVKVGWVPTQSSMKVHSVTVQRTVVGRVASSTRTRRGG